MDHPPTRTLKLGSRGEDVRRFQVALNARGEDRRHPTVSVDGEYGKQTARLYYDVGAELGLLRSTLLKGPTKGAQRVVRSPKTRTPAQLLLARVRGRKRKTAPLRVRALSKAQAYLAQGVKEVGGNNVGAAVVKIIKMNGGVPGESWCGDFVAACYILAGSKLVQRMWASTIWLASHLTPVKHPLPGHIMVYNFGSGGPKHTGIFEEWEIVGHSFYAIEGNTKAGSSVSDSGGGEGVGRRLRTVDEVIAMRRIST